MGCYTAPAAAAIIHFFMRKKIPSMKLSKYQLWLNQLFLGGAIFGIVDHWWNGELFLMGENLIKDLMLGLMITVVIFAIASLMVLADKWKKPFIVKTGV